MDRMFDRFMEGFSGSSGRSWGAVGPVIDVDDTEKEMIVTAELPGVAEKDVEVSLAGDILTIKGQKKSESEEKQGQSYYAERTFGSFARSLRLPFDVKDETVDAKFRDGVLTIRLPKPADVQKAVRKIDVKATGK
jgi:HSP20 family protein